MTLPGSFFDTPDLSERLDAPEQMDDFSRAPAELDEALRDLRGVNRWLGGFRSVRQALRPLARRRSYLRVLDLGAGSCDVPARLVEWADARYDTLLQVVAVDANPTVVRQARRYLDERLHPRLRPQVLVEEGDALDLRFDDGDFDAATASLFLHHFADDAARLLCEMDRVATSGLIVSDLHRHPWAYTGIRAVAKLLPVSPMFTNDAPLSVRRGFTREELDRLARAAGLNGYVLRWRWAFRWVLSTVD
jgi:SAM-dependent methyltransferase